MEGMPRAPRNRTLWLNEEDTASYHARLLHLREPVALASVLGRTICQDMLEAAQLLPDGFVDLLVLDPPYNLTKTFNETEYRKRPPIDYAACMDRWLTALRRLLKPTASVYICSEWTSSAVVHAVAAKHLKVRNRITWEREKGRGSLANWKNCAEDIWFCTVSEQYTFNVDAVKLKRRVMAPYTDDRGNPKDWNGTAEGNFRLTHPSNLWTDITIPFWSMPENTDHPTQKPEKLVAKIVLASSNPGDIVLDPFVGAGTTAVVAKKLRRRFIGIELDETYCCLTEKRLDLADRDPAIQGYRDGVFWERNSLADQQRGNRNGKERSAAPQANALFGEGV